MNLINYLLVHKRCTAPPHEKVVKTYIVPWCDSRACYKCLHESEGTVLYNRDKVLKFMEIEL